jgi:putative tryptophan/tyrosine transport system substrate-binding protein
MHRRSFIILAGSAAAAWPRDTRAQRRERRVAVLMGAAPTQLGSTYLSIFLGRLGELGWKVGDNLRTETRWWTGGPDQMRRVINELLAFAPDVIMVFSNLALEMLKPMAGNVPIVFVGVGDPVGAGFVASLGRPGGNITGFSGTDGPIGGKWIEVLKETAPHLRRVLAILHLETPVHRAFWRAIEDAAPRFGVEAVSGGVHDAADIEKTVSSFAARPDDGMIVAPHAVTWANEPLLIKLGLRHRLPSHYATAGSVKAGGLVSYGHDFEDSFRKTAEQVDRVLRGEKAGDLPVQQPTKFKLVLNLQTARTIGLTIPPSVQALADEMFD